SPAETVVGGRRTEGGGRKLGTPADDRKRSQPFRRRTVVALVILLVGVGGFFALRPTALDQTARNPANSKPHTPNPKPLDFAAAKSTRFAVLPLDNFSPDAKDEYLAGGMTEELTASLSKISGLEVIA